MLTNSELRRFLEEHAGTKVLSVYLDTRVTDPAMRNAWRTTLSTGLRDLRGRIPENERADFDRAAKLLENPSPAPGGVWAAPGWVAFATADGRFHADDLPAQTTQLFTWEEGPVVAPYLRALKEHRPVIVAMVESDSAHLYRYARTQLESIEEHSVSIGDAPGKERISGSVAPSTSTPAARGAVGTDDVQRRRQAAFQRLGTWLTERLAKHAGDQAWVVIGGTAPWAQQAAAALPRQLAERTQVASGLHHGARPDEIAKAAKAAATELRAAQGGRLVDQLVEHAGEPGRAAAGVPAVQRALLTRAVDMLLLSPEFIRAHPAEAEQLVRATLRSGGDVEVPSGSAAEKLDHAVEGVAARLRFPIEEPAGATS